MDRSNDIFTVKLTAATVIDGEIAKAGELVELTKREAENLLGRGRAELATEEQLEALEREAEEEGKRILAYQEEQLEAQKRAKLVAEEAAAKRKEELEGKTVADLEAMATAAQIDLGGATKKADIIAAIMAAERAD